MKKRILMCGESSHIASGFGNYTKNILQRLHNTGKYEIAELSCYREPTVPKTEDWKVYPVAVNPSDPLHQEYMSNDANQFGQWRFEFAAIDFKPHIVFDVRDFWNFTYQETSSLRNFYHWMIVPTYDSSPQKIDTINLFYNADTLGFHTEWARDDLITKFNYRGSNIGPICSDAIDHNVFKPIGYSKKFHKTKFNIDADTFVIGSVMRNQKRKLIPDLISSFGQLLKNNTDKKIILYLHTSYPDALAWDLPSLLLEHNVADKVLLTYKCKSCNNFYASVFQGASTNCQHCNKHSAYIASVKNEVEDNQLNQIYNLFDVYVQYAICEGFGIPAIEAAACGVPVITIDHGAMGEVGKNIKATLIPVERIFREQETNAYRIYPNNNNLLYALHNMVNMDRNKLNLIGKNTRKECMTKYNWDTTARKFEEVFDAVDISKKLDWDMPLRDVNASHVPQYNPSNNRAMIYDIVDNILREPFLKQTNFIEEIIKNLNDGFVQAGPKMMKFDINMAIKILEIYLKNKGSIEQIRVNPDSPLSDRLKSFFEYSQL